MTLSERTPFMNSLNILTYQCAVCVDGLLSNIRAGDAAIVSLAIPTVHFAFWSCVWHFLHAPTQNPLLCVGVPHVYVRVTIHARPSQEARATADLWQRLASLLALEPNVHFTDIRHHAWSSTRAWMHRWSFACYFVHLVTLRMGSFTVDVVDERADDDDNAVLSIKVCAFRCSFARSLLVCSDLSALSLVHACVVSVPL